MSWGDPEKSAGNFYQNLMCLIENARARLPRPARPLPPKQFFTFSSVSVFYCKGVSFSMVVAVKENLVLSAQLTGNIKTFLKINWQIFFAFVQNFFQILVCVFLRGTRFYKEAMKIYKN